MTPVFLPSTTRAQCERAPQHPRNLGEIHEYWRSPDDGANSPESYLDGVPRSAVLADIISRYAARDTPILEVGCNVGRNLNFLFRRGFSDLAGIEISEAAVRLLGRTFPEMARVAKILNGPVEGIAPVLDDGRYGMVYTMAVLEHIHPSSEWVFGELVRITDRYLITIEDERNQTWRHFPRKYDQVFTSLGMNQVEENSCAEVPGLGPVFVARVFEKRSTDSPPELTP